MYRLASKLSCETHSVAVSHLLDPLGGDLGPCEMLPDAGPASREVTFTSGATVPSRAWALAGAAEWMPPGVLFPCLLWAWTWFSGRKEVTGGRKRAAEERNQGTPADVAPEVMRHSVGVLPETKMKARPTARGHCDQRSLVSIVCLQGTSEENRRKPCRQLLWSSSPCISCLQSSLHTLKVALLGLRADQAAQPGCIHVAAFSCGLLGGSQALVTLSPGQRFFQLELWILPKGYLEESSPHTVYSTTVCLLKTELRSVGAGDS